MTIDTPTGIVAAYAASAGLSPADAESVRRRVLADGRVGGLEVPVVGDILDPGPEALVDALGSDGVIVVTLIGSALASLEADESIGLASTSPEGRMAALRSIARVRDEVVRLHDVAGRRVAIAVEVHSAPRAWHGSSIDAFAASLEEVAAWDWGGAEILVEHCDAARPPAPFSKGFLSLDDELRAIALTQAPVGMVINWGRSAIEGRSIETPLTHIAAAREHGILRGFTYSGASDDAAGRGGAWADVHLPPAAATPLGGRSLLANDVVHGVRAELGLATGLEFVGLKVSLGRDVGLAARVRMFELALDATFGA